MMKKETESENNEISESYSFVCCNKCQNLGRLTVATELDAAVLICWAGCVGVSRTPADCFHMTFF